MTLTSRQRFHAIGLFVLMLVGAVYPLSLASWYIEDAAISFAYARNAAAGEGLVTFPGGERVEGYSNPTWVALMTLWELVGVDGFWSSKIMGSLFGAFTLPFVYAAARHLRPDRDDDTPLLATAFTAFSAQYVIWNACGLENSLFVFLLAGATWRTLAETERGRWPIGPFFWFLLAISRPEGMLYAAIGGFWAMAYALADGRGLLPTLRWLIVYFAPWGAYQLAHWWYFAYPLPNTYYAKTDANDFQPWNWNTKGWKYIRRFSHEMGQGYMLPVYLLGLLGARGWRRSVWIVSVVLIGILLLYPGLEWMKAIGGYPKLPDPKWWVTIRVWTLFGLALLLPRLAIGRPGWRALVLAWDLSLAALFFSHWSGGDWMRGFRWMSTLVVPSSLLLAAGVAVLADAVQWNLGRLARERWTTPAYVLVAFLLSAFISPNATYVYRYTGKPETGPYTIQKRVNYVHWVQKRLHVEGPIRNLDVDQGAHLWWSGHQMLDIAGLVDVPMGHHNYQKAFIHEYIFEEMRPHFAHAHGSWAGTMRIAQHPEWKKEYLEIPGYPSGKTSLHVGNHVRKDLLIDPEWTGTPGRRVHTTDGVVIEGWEIPTGSAAPGRKMYLEVGLSTRERAEKADDFRVMAFLADDAGHVQSWSLPPGYDWYETHEWETTEIFHGRFSLWVRKDVPVGTYDLGFVILGPDGAVVRPTGKLPEGAVVGGPGDSRFAVGEIRFPAAVRVMGRSAIDDLAEADTERAKAVAASGDCVEAEAIWLLARRRETQRDEWQQERAPAVETAFAKCWAQHALEGDRTARLAAIVSARRWDHRDPDVLAAAAPLAEALYAEGQAAYEAQEWESAYRLLSDALKADPSLAWARRWAEEARDQRLGLTPEAVAAQKENEKIDRAAKREKRPPKTPKAPKDTDGGPSPKPGLPAPIARPRVAPKQKAP